MHVTGENPYTSSAELLLSAEVPCQRNLRLFVVKQWDRRSGMCSVLFISCCCVVATAAALSFVLHLVALLLPFMSHVLVDVRLVVR